MLDEVDDAENNGEPRLGFVQVSKNFKNRPLFLITNIFLFSQEHLYRQENLRSANFRHPKSALVQVIVLTWSKNCNTESDFGVLGYVILKLFLPLYNLYLHELLYIPIFRISSILYASLITSTIFSQHKRTVSRNLEFHLEMIGGN